MQADLKTMAAIGVYAAAAVTCITVQNSRGVQAIEPLRPELVAAQIRAVLDDHRVTHIKTGMIGNAAIAEAINKVLADFKGEIVVDPVLRATTGQDLMEQADLDKFRTRIVSLATILTPNLPELKILAGKELQGQESIMSAAQQMLNEYRGLRGILVKGGHTGTPDQVTDILVYRSQSGIQRISSTRPRIRTSNTHGTGCTLASAFAAYHSLTGDDREAFALTTDYMQQVLEHSRHLQIVRNPEGCGGLLHVPPRKKD